MGSGEWGMGKESTKEKNRNQKKSNLKKIIVDNDFYFELFQKT